MNARKIIMTKTNSPARIQYSSLIGCTVKILKLSLFLLVMGFCISCATWQEFRAWNASQSAAVPPQAPPPQVAAARPEPIIITAFPERPERAPIPEVPAYIMGTGLVPASDLSEFLLIMNPDIDRAFAESLAFIYVEEAAAEGVNHDVAFAQMSLETGFLRFGNLVLPEQNNFAGLGATGPGFPGLSFDTPRIGVRAQIQHLKAYACTTPLNNELVNPRYRFVRRGSSPTIKGLAGTWAADPEYAVKIKAILTRLYEFSFGG